MTEHLILRQQSNDLVLNRWARMNNMLNRKNDFVNISQQRSGSRTNYVHEREICLTEGHASYLFTFCLLCVSGRVIWEQCCEDCCWWNDVLCAYKRVHFFQDSFLK